MEKSGNKISVSGAVVIIISFLLFSFAQYRPNRVLTGTNVFARELFESNFLLLLLFSFLILIFTIINSRRYVLFVGGLSLLLIGLTLYFFGIALERESFQVITTGRMSIGGGFWLALLGTYMVINGSFKGFYKAILYRRIFYIFILLIMAGFLISGHLNSLSVMKEFANRSSAFFSQINRHFSLSFLSVLVSILIGIPAGILIYISKKANHPALFIINLGQTVPTLSLLGLIMAPLTLLGEQSDFLRNLGVRGVGFTPAFIVLIIYALFPVIHNTIAGLKLVDDNLLEVAKSLGMDRSQVFWKVQLPLSLPVILGGIRTAMTQSIGNTILAGLIGGGGLGSIIFLGLAQAAPDLILLGIIPLVIMAFLLDSFFSFFLFFYRRKFSGEIQ